MNSNSENIYNNLIAITNKNLCQREYLAQINTICQVNPRALILREKDLSQKEYEELSINVFEICNKYNIPMFVHSYMDVAKRIGCKNIHLSITGILTYLECNPNIIELVATEPSKYLKENINLQNYIDENKLAQINSDFNNISISCHSLTDVRIAEVCGANQIILGTIFETDCKKGLKGKGVSFVKAICETTDIPVFAIGGIDLSKLKQVMDVGASGGCMMSGFMKM